MMEFQPLTMDAVTRVKPFFRFAPWRTCDYTTGGMFMWRDYYRMEYCIEDDALFVRQHDEQTGEALYNVPLSADTDRALRLLTTNCADENGLIRFCIVPENAVETVLRHGAEKEVKADRDLSDYLYTAESMKTFSGRHLAGQRNHMKHFARDHADIRFEELTEENLHDAEAFFREVYLEHTQSEGFEREENRMTLEVMEHYEAYGFRGGILYADGCVAGFSLGETVNDTLYVHIEKSRRDCDGCYQTLTNEFAKRYCDESIRYVNREEDMGDAGLRYAKNAYHPTELLAKYTVTIAV